MLGQARVSLVLLVLVLPLLSCTRIQEPRLPGEGVALPLAELTEADAIPAEWGKLISVSGAPAAYGPVFQLWFQDEEGTIHRVLYDADTPRLLPDVRVIRRN